MASLPSAHPTVSLHLTDPALTPLISSSSTLNPQSPSPRYRALTDLTTASITAYNSTERLGFGRPQRIMIDTTKYGPVILHAFLNVEQPQPRAAGAQSPASAEGLATAAAVLDQTREALRPLSSSTADEDEEGVNDPANKNADRDARAGEEAAGGLQGTLPANGQPITNSTDKGKGLEEQTREAEPLTADEGKLAPLLIATVVAPSHDQEARRAMGKLEKLGLEFQRRWVMEHGALRDDRGAEEGDKADG